MLCLVAALVGSPAESWAGRMALGPGLLPAAMPNSGCSSLQPRVRQGEQRACLGQPAVSLGMEALVSPV